MALRSPHVSWYLHKSFSAGPSKPLRRTASRPGIVSLPFHGLNFHGCVTMRTVSALQNLLFQETLLSQSWRVLNRMVTVASAWCHQTLQRTGKTLRTQTRSAFGFAYLAGTP